MEDKRLDFDAPLLSARRFSAPGVASVEESSGRAARKPSPRRASLPLYKSELKSGPVAKPGIVPFLWEQTPGRPKEGPAASSVRTRPPDRRLAPPRPPPGRILKDKDLDSSPSAQLQSPLSSSLEESKVGTLESPVSGPNNGKEEAEEKRPMPVHCQSDDDGEEEDAFSDALDTLSRTESFFMNCSISGLTGGPDITEPSGSFATDPQLRDFMMGRFLPAAQAMASSSPQCAPRKPSAPVRETAGTVKRVDNVEYRRLLPLPYQHKTNYVPQYARELDEEDGYDGDEYDHTSHLASKACGLLPQFCLKSSFCLLNPVPGMKVPGRLTPSSRRIKTTLNKNLHHSSLGQIGDEYSWEAVYKHKLGHGESPQLEEGSKLTSESNQLTNWSDSPTADGSSPYRRSAGGISPYRNEASQSPFHEGKGFLGVPKSARKSSCDSCEKDHENSWEVATHSGSLKGSGSISLAVERTLFVDSVLTPEILHSKSSSIGSTTDIKSSIDAANKNSKVEVECQRMEEIHVIEAHEEDKVQLKDSEYVEPGLQFLERSGHGEMGHNNSINLDSGHDDPLPFKAEDQGKNDVNPLQSLLPPPLPKSPSESWLWRTLPSVSAKNPLPQSFLGIQVQSRRQAFPVCATSQKQEGNVKPSKLPRQIRFADVLTKPMSPK